MSLVELSLPPNAPSPLLGDEEVPVYVNSDIVQTTTTAAIAAIPEPVYLLMAGAGQTYTPPQVGGTIIVNKLIGSPTAINLPSVPTGTVYVIKDGKGDANTNNITITPLVGNIDGGFNYLINWPQGAVTLQFDGSNWKALSNMASGGGGGVTAFNGRSGSVVMGTTDIVNAGGATVSYVQANYLPLTGGAISGDLSVAGGLTAPTMPTGDNTDNVATTAFVEASVAASTTGVATWNGRTGTVVLTTADITGAGGATAAQLGSYLPLTGGAITGPVTAPTPAPGNNSTSLATTAFVSNAVTTAPYLPLVGGTLTGVLNVSPPAGNASIINLNKPSSGQYNILRGSTNGNRRWEVVVGDFSAELGNNAGSNFSINGFDDTGNTNLGQYFQLNRANGSASFIASVAAGSYTCSGSGAGYFMGSRSGSGDTYGVYNPDGGGLHLWDSSVGDIAIINNTTAQFYGQVMSCAYGSQGQIRMLPGPTAAGVGAMWRNDGANLYLLFTNNNDALGTWNNLRPFTVSQTSGAVTMSQGLTASNINTQYGIIYSGYAGNVVSFRWTGVLQIFIDGNYNGDIATNQSIAGNYLPISGGTVTGSVTVNGNLTCPSGTIQGGDVRAFGYVTRAGYNGGWGNNHFNFNWVSPYMSGYVDNTGLGNISFSSDYRIKRNVTNLGSMWDKVKALRPVRYNIRDFTPPGGQRLFTADDVERWGFIAHELQDTLIQDAASGVKDQADHIQAPNPWTVIASLTKALQEAMARIEALEAAT